MKEERIRQCSYYSCVPPQKHILLSLYLGLKRLTLFGETVAVYCENHMKANTLCGQNAEFFMLNWTAYSYNYAVWV
jgi:hypothetical protein